MLKKIGYCAIDGKIVLLDKEDLEEFSLTLV